MLHVFDHVKPRIILETSWKVTLWTLPCALNLHENYLKNTFIFDDFRKRVDITVTENLHTLLVAFASFIIINRTRKL